MCLWKSLVEMLPKVPSPGLEKPVSNMHPRVCVILSPGVLSYHSVCYITTVCVVLPHCVLYYYLYGVLSYHTVCYLIALCAI